jgi:predicted nucleic acid-binding protein
MSVLVDTNILLRRIQPDHEHHTLAIDSVARLLATGEQVYFTLQNISEFWNVMTRPIAVNGLGFWSRGSRQTQDGRTDRRRPKAADHPKRHSQR